MSHERIDRNLVYEFFSTYFRLECALKQAGFRRAKSKNDNSVEADWKRFVTRLGKMPAEKLQLVLDAGAVILAHPSKRQILNAEGKLDWEDMKIENKGLVDLCVCLSCIRNNLFHGGKYQAGLVEGTERDDRLLLEGTKTLKAIFEMAELA